MEGKETFIQTVVGVCVSKENMNNYPNQNWS